METKGDLVISDIGGKNNKIQTVSEYAGKLVINGRMTDIPTDADYSISNGKIIVNGEPYVLPWERQDA